MTKQEIDLFITVMKEVYEDWTPERAEERFGDCATAKEALEKRLSAMRTFYDFVDEVVKKDWETLGIEYDRELVDKVIAEGRNPKKLSP